MKRCGGERWEAPSTTWPSGSRGASTCWASAAPKHRRRPQPTTSPRRSGPGWPQATTRRRPPPPSPRSCASRSGWCTRSLFGCSRACARQVGLAAGAHQLRPELCEIRRRAAERAAFLELLDHDPSVLGRELDVVALVDAEEAAELGGD